MELRALRADGVERFVDELWLPAQREMAALSGRSLAEDARASGLDYRRSRIDDEDAVTWLAVVDGDPVGFASAAVRTPPPIFEPERACDVEELFVTPARRREGVASALLDAVEDWARGRDCARLRLYVHADNDAALALYEDRGHAVRRHELGKPLDDGP